MTKFKVGDKVRVVCRVDDNPYGWADGMTTTMNKKTEFTIRSGFKGRDDGIYYHLENDGYTWPEKCLEKVGGDAFITTVFKVDSMEFDTIEAAADHLQRKTLDEFIKGCGGEEKFVNYIMNNKQKFIDILMKEYK